MRIANTWTRGGRSTGENWYSI